MGDRKTLRFLQHKGGIQRRHRNSAFERLDASGDVVMGGSDERRAGGPRVMFSGVQYGRGKGRGRKQRNHQFKKDMKSRDNHVFGTGWHKVTIFNGASFDRDVILSALVRICRVSFIPVCAVFNGLTWLVIGNHLNNNYIPSYSEFEKNAAFFVEDRHMAEALAECSGKLTMPLPGQQGEHKVFLRILQNVPMTAPIKGDCELKIKAALDKRYDIPTQTLNLSKFYVSPEFCTDYFLPLNRPSVAGKLTELLEPHFPGILGLDLSDNKLATGEVIGKMITKATSLKALSLRNNHLRDLISLDKIRHSNLQELILEGNPLSSNRQDKEAFVRFFQYAIHTFFNSSSVQKRFPKLSKLDGEVLTPSISFDVSEPTKHPEVRSSSFCNEQARDVVLRFWDLFVKVFDSEDRQPLLNAYHDTAMMSMMSSYTQGHVSTAETYKKLSHYLQDSRNCLKITDKGKRMKQLRNGKLDIVSYYTKFPKTQHDFSSFLIDMPVAVENFIVFNVSGVYKEREERNSPLRYFCRTMTLVPQNEGFVITNEMMFITNPTNEQTKMAFQRPAPATPVAVPPSTPATVVSPAAPALSPVALPPPAAILTEETKLQMLNSFCQQSGMNQDWSTRCLEQNGWDFQKSALIFTQLRDQNKIPPEAFVK